jgi:hypothetical protein
MPASLLPRRFAPTGAEDGPYRHWQRPTLGEFLRQIEHEFGGALDVSALDHTGLAYDENLSPGELAVLCRQIGVPPGDFGLDG